MKKCFVCKSRPAGPKGVCKQCAKNYAIQIRKNKEAMYPCRECKAQITWKEYVDRDGYCRDCYLKPKWSDYFG